MADDDASTLTTQAQSIFDQAKQILNSKDANGNYLYGGENDTTPPVNVDSLSDLAALPGVSDAFSNGTIKKSVNVGGGQTVQVGLLASDLGTQLFQSLSDIANFNTGPNGPLRQDHQCDPVRLPDHQGPICPGGERKSEQSGCRERIHL